MNFSCHECTIPNRKNNLESADYIRFATGLRRSDSMQVGKQIGQLSATLESGAEWCQAEDRQEYSGLSARLMKTGGHVVDVGRANNFDQERSNEVRRHGALLGTMHNRQETCATVQHPRPFKLLGINWKQHLESFVLSAPAAGCPPTPGRIRQNNSRRWVEMFAWHRATNTMSGSKIQY